MAHQIPEHVNEEFIRKLHLRSGLGSGEEGDRCSIQEYRAWIGLDPSKDSIPKGDSNVVGRYIIAFQDRIINAGATDAQVFDLVAKHLPRLRGSYGSAELERRRSYMLVDMTIRQLAPMWLELTPALAPHAEKLRALPEIVDQKTLEAAHAVRDSARSAAWTERNKVIETFKEHYKTTF